MASAAAKTMLVVSMKNALFPLSALLSLALALPACSGAAESTGHTFAAESLLVMTSELGSYRVEVRTSPDQPPTRGELAAQFIITDAHTGAPQSGLELQVVPWMPAMGHGTSVKPIISETAPGSYLIDQLLLFMPGDWQIRTELDGAVSDHVTPTLEIR
jgi:hypothetical protein